jgi:hypothetical protein
MEYIASCQDGRNPIIIFDKIMGNAAALLAVIAKAREVFSPLGSELAIKTLDRYGIKYHLTQIVPFIMREDGRALCPMEQLSLGQSPDEFYEIMKARL